MERGFMCKVTEDTNENKNRFSEDHGSKVQVSDFLLKALSIILVAKWNSHDQGMVLSQETL